MTTYHVAANKRGKWWVLQGVEFPSAFSQVHRLAEAETVAREAVAFVSGEPEDSFDLVVVPEVPEAFRTERALAEQASRQAGDSNREAAEHSRRAVRALTAAGYTLRDIGDLMGISHQRAAQLRARI
jgi:hypothetical protein